MICKQTFGKMTFERNHMTPFLMWGILSQHKWSHRLICLPVLHWVLLFGMLINNVKGHPVKGAGCVGGGSTHRAPWKILGCLFGNPPNTPRSEQAGRDARDLGRLCPEGRRKGLSAPPALPTPLSPHRLPGSALLGRGEKRPSWQLLLKCSCGCFWNSSAVNSMCLPLTLSPVHWSLPRVLSLLWPEPRQEWKALTLSL